MREQRLCLVRGSATQSSFHEGSKGCVSGEAVPRTAGSKGCVSGEAVLQSQLEKRASSPQRQHQTEGQARQGHDTGQAAQRMAGRPVHCRMKRWYRSGGLPFFAVANSFCAPGLLLSGLLLSGLLLSSLACLTSLLSRLLCSSAQTSPAHFEVPKLPPPPPQLLKPLPTHTSLEKGVSTFTNPYLCALQAQRLQVCWRQRPVAAAAATAGLKLRVCCSHRCAVPREQSTPHRAVPRGQRAAAQRGVARRRRRGAVARAPPAGGGRRRRQRRLCERQQQQPRVCARVDHQRHQLLDVSVAALPCRGSGVCATARGHGSVARHVSHRRCTRRVCRCRRSRQRRQPSVRSDHGAAPTVRLQQRPRRRAQPCPHRRNHPVRVDLVGRVGRRMPAARRGSTRAGKNGWVCLCRRRDDCCLQAH
eukprot:365810-Chlamydomonas_euryale.AAC.41